jgi:hypothetical protein
MFVELGIFKWFGAALRVGKIVSTPARLDRAAEEGWTHVTSKALPAPFPAERFNSLVTWTNTLLAPLAFRHAQSDMTCFAVRVTFVDRKADFVVLIKNYNVNMSVK